MKAAIDALCRYVGPYCRLDARTRFERRSELAGAVSPCVTAEIASSLGIKVRTRQIAHQTVNSVRAAYRRMLDRSLVSVDIEAADFVAAEALPYRHDIGLRTPDALHLAVALRMNMTLGTRDANLARACAAPGWPAELV